MKKVRLLKMAQGILVRNMNVYFFQERRGRKRNKQVYFRETKRLSHLRFWKEVIYSILI